MGRAVALGFLRLTTRRSVFANPLKVEQACVRVELRLAAPTVLVVRGACEHERIPRNLLIETERAGT